MYASVIHIRLLNDFLLLIAYVMSR